MRYLKIFLFIACCFLSAISYAQSPKHIEADLLRSFNKISYWDEKRNDAGGDDSLENANKAFSNKLKRYTSKYPSTIGQNFNQLTKAGLSIINSPDSLFRIYCWDTFLGGTMRKFTNLAQYRSGTNVRSMLIITGGYEPLYSNLYTIKTGAKTYYLAINKGILSSAYLTQSVKIFSIDQGQLNPNAKLIKTKSGLINRLDVDSDLSSKVNSDINTQPDLTYNPTKQTIQIPLITSEGKITSKFITYKFNGKYFEKVKS